MTTEKLTCQFCADPMHGKLPDGTPYCLDCDVCDDCGGVAEIDANGHHCPDCGNNW